MAIKVTKDLVTSEGFAVSECFCFLSIYLTNGTWSNCAYYKSEADYEAGKQPLNIQELPTRFDLTISAETFWGTELATDIHNQCITQIEAVIGTGTCEIVTLEP